MSLKKLKIISIIIAFVLCFPIHFIYDLFPNFISSIFAPVNESIWEHMKILFTSIVITGVIQKIIVKKKNLNFNNVCISNVTSGILSIPIYLIMFIPIYNLMGENLFISLFIMLITIIISEWISYSIMNMKDLGLEDASIILVIAMYVIFIMLTYNPPSSSLFEDPIDHYHGIKKVSLF